MTSRSLLAVALLAVALPAVALPAAAQRLVPEQSEVAFTSRQMGVPVDGSFRKFDAQVSFDPKRPEAGRIAITIDTGSASFGAPETDAEVPKPAWFDVARFPQATFQSTAIKGVGDSRYDVGKLTLKGRTRDIVVPVTLAASGATTTASGAFTLKRLDFRIGEGEWADASLVADEVQVRFKLALAGLPSP
jgi:polyisoprenoid-binding protein YceI